MTLADVEQAARELLQLARDQKWSRANTQAAYRRMRTLRTSGFSNRNPTPKGESAVVFANEKLLEQLRQAAQDAPSSSHPRG